MTIRMDIRQLLRPIWTLTRILSGLVIIVEGSCIAVMVVPALFGFFDELAVGQTGVGYHAAAVAPVFIFFVSFGLVVRLGMAVMGGIPTLPTVPWSVGRRGNSRVTKSHEM